MTSFSTRGIGYEWIGQTAKDRPILFGSGGWQDGNPYALMRTNKNVQVEESMAMQGMGHDGNIDSNPIKVDMANTNNEFNFNQFKSGQDPEPDKPLYPGGGEIKLYSDYPDGLASGDTNVMVDPYSDSFDQTAQAIGMVCGHIWPNQKGETDSSMSNELVAGGENPFKGYTAIGNNAKAMEESVEHFSGTGTNPETEEETAPVNWNVDTGLRRMNLRKTQSELMEKVAVKGAIMKSYEDASEAYEQMTSQRLKGAGLTGERREELLKNSRFPGSEYTANQAGLYSISKESKSRYGGKKSGTSTNLLSNLSIGI